jgi:uncharacterized protein (DUF736 family)
LTDFHHRGKTYGTMRQIILTIRNCSLFTLKPAHSSCYLPTGVRMEPNKEKRGEDSPDVYFKYKNAQIGAGWEKIAVATGNKYISVTIDDPSLTNPVNATLHPNGADGYELVHRR